MPDCFLTWTEPPDANGDEVFRLSSWRRNLTLKGKSFRAFENHVLPLLNGQNSVDQICEAVSHIFRREEVVASIDLLAAQGVVVEGAHETPGKAQSKMTTQLGWLGETAPAGRAAQGNLTGAHVVLFGAGAHGAACARSLVAAGVGALTVVDPATVGPTDLYFSGQFRSGDIGQNRAAALVGALAHDDVQTKLNSHGERPADAQAILPLINDAALVLCCLDSGELNLALLLNLACKQLGKPWIAASLEGSELVIGPGFAHISGEPCYMCWRLREIAAAPNPQTRFALETHLDQAKADLSGRRENIAPSADIVGGMLAAEALTWLAGVGPPNLIGKFLLVELPGLRVEKHAVLRKPGCPACSAQAHS